ncbi:hypothetical protein D3C78_694060 [compost metagenome]
MGFASPFPRNAGLIANAASRAALARRVMMAIAAGSPSTVHTQESSTLIPSARKRSANASGVSDTGTK